MTLTDVADAIEVCSDAERAKLARFFAAQAEEKLSDRPGASRVFSWLGVVAVGRQPHAISLPDISDDDRRYVREMAATLEGVVRDEAALASAETPDDLVGDSDQSHPLLTVWRNLRHAMDDSLSQDRP